MNEEQILSELEEQGLVSEGKALVAKEGQLNWEWGDWALRVEPMGTINQPSGVQKRLRVATQAIDFPNGFTTLLRYRWVSAAYPVYERIEGASWSVHNILRLQKDLILPGMKTSEALRLAGWTPRESGTWNNKRQIPLDRVIEDFERDPSKLIIMVEKSEKIADTLRRYLGFSSIPGARGKEAA